MDFEEFLIQHGFNEPNEDYLWFDCESFYDSDRYLDLIAGLRRISRGRFNPQDIRIAEGKPRKDGVLQEGDPLFNVDFKLLEIRFHLGGKQELIKGCCFEWLDPDIIHEVNRILRENLELNEQFFGMETGDQTLILVYGEPLLKDELQREGLWSDLEDLKIEKPENFSLLEIR